MGIFSVMSIPEFLIRFLLSGLAVYRLTHAFALETGPFALFANAREWIIKKFPGDTWQAQFAQCPLCQSFWGALLAALIVFPVIDVRDTFMIWGSLSGLILIAHVALYR